MEPTDPPKPQRSGSQSRIPVVLVWIAAAAVVFRIVTAMADRGAGTAGDRGAGLVHWEPAASAAVLSTSGGKPILYDFTAAWCPPCHRLDAEAWNDPDTARSIGERFVPARIVDREREDGRNTPAIAELQRRYEIQAFPTLVVADASGRLIAKMEGYPGRERLREFLADALKKAGK